MSRRPNTISSTVNEAGVSSHAPESLDFDTAVNTFLRHCRVKNLTDRTITYYKIVLKGLKRFLDAENVTRPIDITFDTIDSVILARRDTGVKDTTTISFLRGWRAFFYYLHNEGFITENVGSRIKLIKAEKRVLQTFTKEQMRKLLDTPNRATFTGYRDYVLMLLLLDTGVRISEAEGVKVTDINWNERLIKVYGKGRKERFVPFQATLDKHLREYVTIRGPLEHDFLFVNIDNAPMRRRSMQDNVSDYGKLANIKNVRVSPHTFRHTFARLYVTNGGDIFSLQKILGHTTLDVVKIYVNLFGTDVANAHAKFSPLDRLHE